MDYRDSPFVHGRRHGHPRLRDRHARPGLRTAGSAPSSLAELIDRPGPVVLTGHRDEPVLAGLGPVVRTRRCRAMASSTPMPSSPAARSTTAASPWSAPTATSGSLPASSIPAPSWTTCGACCPAGRGRSSASRPARASRTVPEPASTAWRARRRRAGAEADGAVHHHLERQEDHAEHEDLQPDVPEPAVDELRQERDGERHRLRVHQVRYRAAQVSAAAADRGRRDQSGSARQARRRAWTPR